MHNQDERIPVSYPAPDPVTEPVRGPQAGKVALATRLFIGLLLSGSGELLRQLEELQEEILADPGLLAREAATQVDTTGDVLRYLAISLLLRGERRVASGIRSGVDLSLGMVRWSLRTLDRLTDNPLGRPLRGPMSSRTRDWGNQLALLIEEGKREEQNSKVLASESISVIVDEVVDLVAENPELDRLIAELVGKKSVGLATVMSDNARSLTATGDYIAEGMLRRLLRRTPRQALPPSPIEGQPQTMYRRRSPVEEVDSDER
jgi:hypothetical protein